MRCPARVRLLALVLGVALGGLGGCDVGLQEPPLEEPPPVLSLRTCYVDDDCVPDACCGLGSAVTHEAEGPNCAGVTCTGSCPAGTIDCGRCVPLCRNSRCAAACQ